MTAEIVAARVRAFVLENFYVSEPEKLGDEDSLIARGVVDSTGFLEIIVFLEAAFSLRIEDHELVPGNFESIARIAAFVARKGASEGALGRAAAPGV
ncbi:MAG TPA: acyl carrier protein [Myxococcales bacterium]|nr:acyl carrier protein [Myxococcales bacterium]